MDSYWPLLVLLLLAQLLIGSLVRVRNSLLGTTMMAPWWWCVTSITAIVIAELFIAFASRDSSPAWVGILRYIAAVGSFCPIMAVLGAKRPQDSGWPWVVLTLWVVLSLPAVHAMVTRTEANFQLHFTWKAMLVGLIVMQTINYADVRAIASAILAASAQIALLAPQLLGHYGNSIGNSLIALMLLLLAVRVVQFIAQGTQENSVDGKSSSTLKLWHRFRHLYGTFWTYRVMGLINQTALAANWPVSLFPEGFYLNTTDNETDHQPVIDLPPDLEKEIHQSLRNTLRRFLAETELNHQGHKES